MADTTTTTSAPALRSAATRCATVRMRSGLPTLVPPYFWTISIPNRTARLVRSAPCVDSEDGEIDVAPRIPSDVAQQSLHLDVGIDEVHVQRGVAQQPAE